MLAFSAGSFAGDAAKIQAMRGLSESPPSQTSVYDHQFFNGKETVRHRYTLTTIGQDWQLIAERNLDAEPLRLGDRMMQPPEPGSAEAREVVLGTRDGPRTLRTRVVVLKVNGKTASYSDDFAYRRDSSLFEEGTVNYLTSFGLSHAGWVGPRDLRWKNDNEFSLQKEARVMTGKVETNDNGQVARCLIEYRGKTTTIDYHYASPDAVEPYHWVTSGPGGGGQSVTLVSREQATEFPPAGLSAYALR